MLEIFNKRLSEANKLKKYIFFILDERPSFSECTTFYDVEAIK